MSTDHCGPIHVDKVQASGLNKRERERTTKNQMLTFTYSNFNFGYQLKNNLLFWLVPLEGNILI